MVLLDTISRIPEQHLIRCLKDECIFLQFFLQFVSITIKVSLADLHRAMSCSPPGHEGLRKDHTALQHQLLSYRLPGHCTTCASANFRQISIVKCCVRFSKGESEHMVLLTKYVIVKNIYAVFPHSAVYPQLPIRNQPGSWPSLILAVWHLRILAMY